jgi:hypothetical protein
MDEPEPMPAFTFNPDGPTTITYPDGTVSVNAPLPDPLPDDTSAATVTAPTVTAPSVTAPSVTAPPTQSGDIPSTTSPPEQPLPPEQPESPEPPEPPEPQPVVTSIVPEPSGGIGQPGADTTVAEAAVPADAPNITEPPDWGATPADTTASDSVVNPDGSITTRLPDGSTQTVVRLPGGATIVTSTTPPGASSQPGPPDSSRARRRKGRSR